MSPTPVAAPSANGRPSRASALSPGLLLRACGWLRGGIITGTPSGYASVRARRVYELNRRHPAELPLPHVEKTRGRYNRLPRLRGHSRSPQAERSGRHAERANDDAGGQAGDRCRASGFRHRLPIDRASAFAGRDHPGKGMHLRRRAPSGVAGPGRPPARPPSMFEPTSRRLRRSAVQRQSAGTPLTPRRPDDRSRVPVGPTAETPTELAPPGTGNRDRDTNDRR
jgi:hypothetical protein